MRALYRFIRAITAMFVAGSLAALVLYFGLRAWLGHSPVVAFTPMKASVTPYYDQHPLPYLLILALAFALVYALWLAGVASRVPARHWLQIGALPVVAVLLAGQLCGMLWVYHDMQSGFFPEAPQMLAYLRWGAVQGLVESVLVALRSFPLNVLGYAAAWLLMVLATRFFASPQQPGHAATSEDRSQVAKTQGQVSGRP